MAANQFNPHMGGQGMPQQQQQQRQQQQQQQQQRPMNGGNVQGAVQQLIFQGLSNQPTQHLTGWQTQLAITERVGLVFSIVGNLRLAAQTQQNPPDLHRMIQIAIRFEHDIFEKSADKAAYKLAVDAKLTQLLNRRNENQAGLQLSIQNQAHAQALAQQNRAAQQQMLMNPNMQGQLNRNMNQQPQQVQPFQHLQHQMQASPLPGQMPPQMMNMQNDGLPQNMNLNQQQQQFQMMQQQLSQQQGQQNMPGRPQGPMALSPQENDSIKAMVERMMAQSSEEEKNRIRATLQSKMDPVQMHKYQSSGVDIASLYYRNNVMQKYRAEKQQRAQLAAQQQGQNMQMQQQQQQQQQPQRSMNPSPLNGGQQPPPMSMGNPDPNFIENIAQQQQQAAALAANHGEMVVPVSNAPRNGTPQPVIMQNPRIQQQQQFVNAQQVQQAQQAMHAQRAQNAAALQQQQSQARLNAQAKTQQFGLQGQPNGMGSGPMPPQPSPAMPNLNAPLRTPQMGNNAGPGNQVNPATAQFGQPLDPRFTQGQNQRPMGPCPGDINAMIASMAPEQRQQMSGLSQEKLQEILAKWNAQQAQAMRNGMSMQGGRSGQQFPPGQFNSQAAAIQQFMISNPGQPLPPALAAGITQHQMMAIQQQTMNKMQNGQQQIPNQMQRNIPPPNDQRVVAQMDNMEFPQIVHTHTLMPRGIPVDVKKWGQLKQWASTNPNLGPTHLENIKNLQKLHYQNLLKTRQQNAGGGMVPGPRGGQPGVSGAPTNGAPVAQMGQQMPMGIRPVAQEEIDAMRRHPQFANAPEEQIRLFIQSRNAQMTPIQQQQRQQQLQNMRQAQHARATPQQNNAMGTPQMNMPQQQARPSQPTPEQPVPAATRPASRQQPPARNSGPTSSPAQPARNLKRASSDDVVEVPNPNIQQQPRPVVQPPQQAQNQAGHQRFTPAQIAALDPEARKKYDAMIRARQIAEQQKQRAICEEESKRPAEAGIPMDPETRQNTAAKLNSIVQPLTNVSKAIGKWFQITRDESRLRAFYRAKFRLQAQFKDNSLTSHKEVFSIRIGEIEQARAMLENIVKDLSEKFPSMVRAEVAQQQNAGAFQASAPVPAPVPVPQPAANGSVSNLPVSVANLEQLRNQIDAQIKPNNNSRNSHRPPAAPTSTQPPFQFGANSPHGTPSYTIKNQITQENLHIPPRKKQKQAGNTTSGQTTPGPNASPELKREQIRSQAKPALVCLEAECDRHNVGFETQEALNAHTQEEHIRPLNDSSKYAQENLASILGLDSQGKPRNVTGQDLSATVVPKQGQTPVLKNESLAGTPMHRQASMNRQASAAGNRSKATPSRDLAPGQKETTQVSTQEIQDPWASATIDPNDLYQAFQPFESGAGGAISDMNAYRSLTPNDTPESSNHVSEPNSDISDGAALDISLEIFDASWEPFGPGVGSGFEMVDDEALKMFDDEPPNYSTWDDFVTSSGPDQPFAFDSSLYSMDAE